MTVIINIWRGKLPQFTVWNAIYGLNVGHASMLVINDENPEDTIYISHRPQTTDSGNSKAKFHKKDTSKQYALLENFTPKAEPISFDEDCKRRGKKTGQKRKPDNQIKILGLSENQIRDFFKRYLNNDLPESESQYNVIENNCSTVVAYFIRKGLGCPQESCDFCSTEMNQSDYKKQKFLDLLLKVSKLMNSYYLLAFTFFIVVSLIKESNIESRIIKNYRNKFWSPRTVEIFAEKVKIETDQNSRYLCRNLCTKK